MNIEDFLPKYPNIINSEYDILNPYKNFSEAIFRKKEFYENRLERAEIFPKERGMLTKHQKTIARYMSSYTPYDRILLVHSMGTGKTCSAIGAIEQIKEEQSNFDGALILARGANILDNFLRELVERCTGGQYIPENYDKLTDLEKIHRIKKKIRFYQLRTFIKFKKIIKQMSDNEIIQQYSNKIIIIDEVHNLRIKPEQQLETMDTYEQYYRFLHLVKNCKVILLSGTPMKDAPEEIASVANLILSEKDKLPVGEQFVEEFMTEKNGSKILDPSKLNVLKQKLKGKISFLRETESSIEKEFIGEKNIGSLKHFIVAPNRMSEFQSNIYKEAVKKDTSTKSGVYINSREATLFVYHDGKYGKEGFEKNVKKTENKIKGFTESVAHYKMDEELYLSLKGTTKEETLKNIRKHSATYADVIKQILETKGNCFIYSSIVQGSGAIIFSLLLNLFGYNRAYGNEKEPGLRYAILTNETSTTANIRKIINRFNRKDNMQGDFIKVIIGSKTISEGFSLKNVVFEAINTAHWNYSETAQALARGIRLGSHNDLLAAGITPVIKIMQPVSFAREDIATQSLDTQSIDLFMYETSEDKDISIRNVLRFLMEISFDCALNYMRNYIDGKDMSRECDYTTCNYECTDMNMELIKQGLNDNELDYSTYQLYYANPKIPLIRKKIEQLFRANHKLDLDSIINNLKNNFTEDEIRNALFTIEEETQSTEFDYKTFLDIYSRTPVKKIANKIEIIFRQYFRLDLQSIVSQLPEYTLFEILTALNILINESVIIINKYGFPSYLREENDVYFLVNNLTINSTFYSEYYTKFPHITTNKTYDEIIENIYKISLPKLVDTICSSNFSDEKSFAKLMSTLPKNIQEMFIEASITAAENKITESVKIRQKILQYFKSFIKKIQSNWVSTLLLEEDNILRCKIGNSWIDCDSSYKAKLIEYEQTRKLKLREKNPYGIMGLYNPTTNAFCIVDFEKEKKNTDDKRLTHSGKVCGAGGWKLPELVSIAVKRLKIPPPDNVDLPNDKDDLIDQIKNIEELDEIFTTNELKNADIETLKSALYWGVSKKQGGNKGIKPICEAIKHWLKIHNLLEADEKCGVQGKKKVIIEKEKKVRDFRIEQYLGSDEKFQEFIDTISKLMGECFGQKTKPEKDNSRWILIFLRTKLVGFMTIDSNNVIWNVCVAKNYRRQGIAKDAMTIATKYICNVRKKQPTLLVDNRNKNAKKLITMYTSFGFEIKRTDDTHTYMQHNCK